MRIFFLIILFLFLRQPSFANNIEDFQIEGINIGDSLLKYFSKNKIEASKQNYFPLYPGEKFGVITLYDKDKLKEFDAVSVTVKPKDQNYKIYSISGRTRFDNKINKCKIRMKSILKDVSEILENLNYREENHPHLADPTGNSMTYGYVFYLKKGAIDLYCVDWSKEYETKSGSTDYLSLVIHSHEMREFLVNLHKKK